MNVTDLEQRLRNALGDRYAIDRELGQGATGRVFLARDLKHDRSVVLKVLRLELTESLAAERFLREIRIAAGLSHPNILTLIDSGTADGLTYYVLPFADGESLRDRLDREGQLSIEETVRITSEVADALDHAHARGVVHRDIKPENILFSAGHAVVADFGISHALDEAGGPRLTRTGTYVGTPLYMSPEQAAAEETVDERSDIYSLACVTYEMLTGEPPYTGSSAQAILARKTLDPVPSLRTVRETVPSGVEAAVLAGLARTPADRPSSAGAFAEALRGEGSRIISATAGWSRPGWKAVVAGAAVVLVAAAVGLAVTAISRDGGAPAAAGFTRLTTDPGVELFPTISPDGEWIVYAGEASGDRDLYLRRVEGRNAINLTEDSEADDDQPAFSPDGERIAFRSERDGGGIFVMERTGEALRRLTRHGFSPAWSPDGTRIAFATERVELNPQNSEGDRGLWLVDLATGQERLLADADVTQPAWSPNGHRIAYTRRLGDPSQADVWTLPAEGGEPRPVTHDVASDWSPAWSPDGQYLYFASNRGGSMNLWRIRIDERSGETEGAPEPITTPATSLAHVDVARDGARLVYSSVAVETNIQAVAIDPATGEVVGDERWVTTGSRRWSNPDPSPDGTRVVFYSLTEPEGDLYVANVDGTGLRAITSDSAIDRVPRWSPDGEWIAFFSNRGGPLQAWAIRPDGSDLTRLTEQPSGVGAWAPDGRIAVAGSPDGVLLLDPYRSGPPPEPGFLPPPPPELAGFRPDSWSPHGRWIAGDLRYLDRGIVVYSVDTGEYERLTDFGQWPVWLPDGRRILFVTDGKEFWVVDRVTKDAYRVYAVRRDVIGPPRPTHDGATIYYSRRSTEADVWLLTLG